MTVNILIQIDKLVQLLESPVFTCKYGCTNGTRRAWLRECADSGRAVVQWLGLANSLDWCLDLRLQLLEPDKYPHLYKCLYGLLMLLPQSSAFAALKNRLNSVSSIGYLHIAPRPYVFSTSGSPSHSRHSSVAEAVGTIQSSPRKNSVDAHTSIRSNATTPSGTSFDRPNRLKGREDGIIRWAELLEKFRSVQERARRAQRHAGGLDDGPGLGMADLHLGEGPSSKTTREIPRGPPVPMKDAPAAPQAKVRSGLGRQLGRLGGAVAGRGKRAQQ
jgi:vacuole morphology and inheritance protein 14